VFGYELTSDASERVSQKRKMTRTRTRRMRIGLKKNLEK
jgi:hypothetical protein